MLTNISGFPELLPGEQIAFNRVVEGIKAQFELHGFSPLDTPAVERVSTLLAKGNDSEIYGLYRLADDQGPKEKDIALRFDLTVPLARYVAQHYGQLTFPYRRYHIAPVWRGERPQAGRYRQFYQCDIDIIGDGELPIIYDAEALSVVYYVFKALGIERLIIKVNNRFLLTGLIKSFGAEQDAVAAIMRVTDKAEKISKDALIDGLMHHGIGRVGAEMLCDLTTKRMHNTQWMEYLSGICDHPEFCAGLTELGEVMALLQNFGVPNECVQIDPTLARGLNYYTGTVSETQLIDYPELGSVCGGGRYADLAGSFSNKKLPGVGFSIGISRLIPKFMESGVFNIHQETPAVVLVTVQGDLFIPYGTEIAKNLRGNGINTEIYLAQKPLGAQMKYANKKGFKFAIIVGEAELGSQQVILRSLSDGTQETMSIDGAVAIINGA